MSPASRPPGEGGAKSGATSLLKFDFMKKRLLRLLFTFSLFLRCKKQRDHNKETKRSQQRNKEITTKKQRDHLPWYNWESCKEITCASLAVSAFRLLSFVRLLLGSVGAILKLIFSQALIWFCSPSHDKTKQKQPCLLHERQQHIMAMPRTRARIRARAVRTRGRGDSGSSLAWIFLAFQSFLLLLFTNLRSRCCGGCCCSNKGGLEYFQLRWPKIPDKGGLG